MKYRNIVTGAVVETACTVTGENWETVQEKETKATPKEEKQAKPKTTSQRKK